MLACREGVILMARSNIKIKFDKKGLEKLAKEVARDSARKGGFDGKCPSCGASVKMQLPVTTCPQCGSSFKVDLRF